jgi:hypothetical protein
MKQQTNHTIEHLSGMIEKSARCLHGTIAYIRTLSINGFYNMNVKDVFKIALSDITDPEIILNLGIRPDAQFVAAANPKHSSDYAQLTDLMFYAFAARIPYLRRNAVSGAKIKDKFLLELYNTCLNKGAKDHGGIIGESFKGNMKSAKISSAKSPEPPFNGEWFRRWVYSADSAGLSAITNGNIFLLGCMDALFPLYYAKLTEILLNELSGVVPNES